MKKIPVYILLFLLFASFNVTGTYNIDTTQFKRNSESNKRIFRFDETAQNTSLNLKSNADENCKDSNLNYIKLISIQRPKYHWKTSNSWFVYF